MIDEPLRHARATGEAECINVLWVLFLPPDLRLVDFTHQSEVCAEFTPYVNLVCHKECTEDRVVHHADIVKEGQRPEVRGNRSSTLRGDMPPHEDAPRGEATMHYAKEHGTGARSFPSPGEHEECSQAEPTEGGAPQGVLPKVCVFAACM